MVIATSLSWVELHQYVSSLQGSNRDKRIWYDIRYPKQSSIDTLVQDGWQILENQDPQWLLMGGIKPEEKRIYYKKGLTYLERDITICHELAHVFYPTNKYREDLSEGDWESVIEYIGRTWRRKAPVLKLILESFHIPTKIYDRVTRKAFSEQRRQKIIREEQPI